MFGSGLIPVVSIGLVFLDVPQGGGVSQVVGSILTTLMDTLNSMGAEIIKIINGGLTTFAPILMTMSIVWLAINLYQRFTARAGR